MEQTDSVRGEEGDGDCLKEGEGISQRTYMKDLWTWTMVGGLIMEVGERLAGGRRRGKIGTSIIA